MPLSLSLRRKGVSLAEPELLTEAARPAAVNPSAIPSTKGYLADVPLGGTSTWNPGNNGGATRQEFADQLFGAYMSCTWASACVDVIARTVTAGGLEITPDDEEDDADDPPPEVKALQDLVDFVNPRENMRQLLRGIVTDVLVYGDAFVEIVYLGQLPAALYSLDSPSMIPICDEHGVISQYIQNLDPFRTATFEPHEVLHFTMEGPRGGVYGTGAIQKALLPITAWLFTAGLLKETMRKGDPPRVHLDYPIEIPRDDIETDRQKWLVKNLGVPNVGNPFITRGGATAADLKVNQVAEYVTTLNQKRDEIIASMGVPPRKLSIAEPGQLGGTGEGTAADKTFRVNTCGPMAEIVLEVFNYSLATLAYGINGWSLKIGEVDWRDDEVIEGIRDQRLRSGAWTLNRYRREIDEPDVTGGDDAVLVDRQNLVLWSDLAALSKATITKAETGGVAPGLSVAMPGVDPNGDGTAPDPEDADPQEGAPMPPATVESALRRPPRSPDDEEAALVEAWNRDFQHRRKKALKELETV